MGKKGYRKKGTKKPIYNNIEFDSIDEVQFYIYLTTLQRYGLLERFVFHPHKISVTDPVVEYQVIQKTLKTKSKTIVKSKIILNEATYTTDFILYGLDDVMKPYFRQSADGTYWCDVKGKWSGTHGSDARYFSLLVKVLYHLKKIFVNKVIVQDLCAQTFVPDELRFTKTGKASSVFKGCRTLEEFLYGR